MTTRNAFAAAAGKTQSGRHVRVLLVMAVMALALVWGCAAPQYDDQTDKLISALQADVDTQFVTLISLAQKISRLDRQIEALHGQTDAASARMLAAAQQALTDATTKAGYDANVPAYDKLAVDLISLQMRVNAEPNDSTPDLNKALANLRDNLIGAGGLQDTHQRDGVLTAIYLQPAQQLIDVQLQALMIRDLILKNGSSGSGSTTK